MPKFGMLTNPRLNIVKEIEEIIKLNFDFVEIGIEGPGGDPRILMKEKEKILKLLKQNNIPTVGHTPWYIELGTEYENVRKELIKECKKMIDVASKLKIPIINFHSHSRGLFYTSPRHKKKILDNFVESLKELVNYGKRKNVQIMMENAGDVSEITSIEDMEYIFDKVDGLKVHVDFGHLFIFNDMKEIRKFVLDYKNRIEHIHIHDNDGIFDKHLPLGKGDLDYREIVKILKEINYDKTITLEVFTSKKDAVESRELIKKMWMK
jgi:sugar phosphate isomerase/epimerase